MSFLTIVSVLILGFLMVVTVYAIKENSVILMHYPILACLVLPILNVVFGITFNVEESFVGSSATLGNLLVTLVHLAVWIICFIIAYKAESKAVLKLYAIFWALTSAIAALTAYINYVETTFNFGWAIPLAVLLLPQWHGFTYFVEGYFVYSIILFSLSFIMFSAVVWRWKNLM